ncbi:glycosyltransferase family 4 protein [Chlamydiota bacterium]
MKKILHTESSPGWGGQELRILREAEGMRERGHEIILALQQGGGLVEPARASGLTVYEIPFKRRNAVQILYQLLRLIHKEKVDIINTHSSLDAWLAGLAGKISRRRVIRTRHLSTPVRKGFNSRLLYNWLADYVVTTCEEAATVIRAQAQLPPERCLSIPTGVDPARIHFERQAVLQFKREHGIAETDCVAGTLCVLRGWKGITDLLHAAKLLEHVPHLKWIVVGSGSSEHQFHAECRALGLTHKVIFTGHLSPPYTALAAMDIFLLLSRGHEGVSQASLQAAWLKKPLVTTTVGGLPEVCLEGITGLQVSKYNPQAVSEAVLRLVNEPDLRDRMGWAAHELVQQRFTLKHTLDQMEALYY